MFDKGKLMREGVPAQALVLEKKVYASGYSTGRTDACRYKLRVKFDDGSTTEINRRVWSHKLAGARVGELIPVRYDAADRSKIEIDAAALTAKREATERAAHEQAVAQGERDLEQQ